MEKAWQGVLGSECSVSAPGWQTTPGYFVNECRKLWKSSEVFQCGSCWQVISWMENCQRAGFGWQTFNYISFSLSWFPRVRKVMDWTDHWQARWESNLLVSCVTWSKTLLHACFLICKMGQYSAGWLCRLGERRHIAKCSLDGSSSWFFTMEFILLKKVCRSQVVLKASN